MKVSKEELLHIANLASLNLKEEEIDTYLLHLQDILNFANIVSGAPVNEMEQSVSVNKNCNAILLQENSRTKDEIKQFENMEALLQNAPEKEENMFKTPKVIQ